MFVTFLVQRCFTLSVILVICTITSYINENFCIFVCKWFGFIWMHMNISIFSLKYEYLCVFGKPVFFNYSTIPTGSRSTRFYGSMTGSVLITLVRVCRLLNFRSCRLKTAWGCQAVIRFSRALSWSFMTGIDHLPLLLPIPICWLRWKRSSWTIPRIPSRRCQSGQPPRHTFPLPPHRCLCNSLPPQQVSLGFWWLPSSRSTAPHRSISHFLQNLLPLPCLSLFLFSLTPYRLLNNPRFPRFPFSSFHPAFRHLPPLRSQMLVLYPFPLQILFRSPHLSPWVFCASRPSSVGLLPTLIEILCVAYSGSSSWWFLQGI